jgi:predicted acetyltransferase
MVSRAIAGIVVRMEPTIRRVTSEELPAFLSTMSSAFFEHFDAEAVADELRQNWDLDRLWSAFDGDRIVSTFRSWATEITVPGSARLPATAIASVSVAPDYRRRGILRRMMAAEHEAARDRGEVAALLYAAEYPIYGRFGYGPACLEATWSLDAATARFHGEPSGSVEIVRPDEAIRDTIIGVFEAWRARQPGEIQRLAYRWDYALGLRTSAGDKQWRGFVALHRNATGTVDGYARYLPEEKWENRQPRSTIDVNELHALDAAAHADLWRFLAGIDWVATVKATRRHPSEPLPWMLVNGRSASLVESGDGLWVRLLDVRRALEARTYERPGRLVLEVIEGDSVDGRARFALDAGPDGATCRPTDRPADLTLNVASLGAAYLGGSPLRDAVRAFGVDEHRAGALAEADALFRTREQPWCSTFF